MLQMDSEPNEAGRALQMPTTNIQIVFMLKGTDQRYEPMFVVSSLVSSNAYPPCGPSWSLADVLAGCWQSTRGKEEPDGVYALLPTTAETTTVCA